MANKIYHKHFTHPIFFFIASVFVLESLTTTTALFGSMTQPPTSPRHRTGKCTKKERQALLHFKSYIRYDPEGRLTTWTPGEEEKVATNDCCYWSGVTCNNQSRVTSLELGNKDLEGKISPSLLNLSYLNYLDLSGNSFNGTIPMFIGSMTQLRYLYLGWNDFSGTIPSELGCLQDLYLYNNQLDGTISEKVWQLPKLQRLDVSSNFLKGAISEKIEKSNILSVNLSNNSLEGVPLEANMSNISSIEDIDLSSCKLGPRFPKWIQTMKNLSSINLANTGISDNIPEDFCVGPSRRIENKPKPCYTNPLASAESKLASKPG
ncbi:putative non-specific serine/threonine protein kinase [Helianthus anomalus]